MANALNLAPISENLTLVHRREDFRAAPDTVSKMYKLKDDGLINLIIDQIKELKGKDKLEEISISPVGEVETKSVKYDVLLPFF